jgi:hypothetical protein
MIETVFQKEKKHKKISIYEDSAASNNSKNP